LISALNCSGNPLHPGETGGRHRNVVANPRFALHGVSGIHLINEHRHYRAPFQQYICRSRQQREPTKLECGLLGALLASTVLAFLFWLGIELSMLTLIIP